MSETTKPAKPKKRVRFGRILYTLVFLGLLAAALYGASWLNARRYFLIVTATEVQVRKGKMLPYGHAAFIPKRKELRRAYETFPLPGGMKLPRGETTFDEWRQLDQALYLILKDAAEYSLSIDNTRTAELTTGYLDQMRALPGLNAAQQTELAGLGRDASYVEARGIVGRVTKDLERAAKLFRTSSKQGGGRFADGEARARAADAAIRTIQVGPPPPPPPTLPPPAAPPTVTSTKTSTTAGRN